MRTVAACAVGHRRHPSLLRQPMVAVQIATHGVLWKPVALSQPDRAVTMRAHLHDIVVGYGRLGIARSKYLMVTVAIRTYRRAVVAAFQSLTVNSCQILLFDIRMTSALPAGARNIIPEDL